MALPKIKTTYSLDPETVATLDALASRWGVSRSEALRRVIRDAGRMAGQVKDSPLDAWGELQKSLGVGESGARAWTARARKERRDASRKREGRGP
jgi:hypothetical protein